MAKTLNKLINEIYGDRPVKGPEKTFIDKHVITQFGVTPDGKDFAGNKVDGPPYKASNQTHTRFPRHGYDPGADKKVYESEDAPSKEKYLDHHEKITYHLQQMLNDMNKHKQKMIAHGKKDDWHVHYPDLKHLSRELEDMHERISDQYTTDVSDSPSTLSAAKHRMGGTKWSNYRVNK